MWRWRPLVGKRGNSVQMGKDLGIPREKRKAKDPKGTYKALGLFPAHLTVNS